MSDWKIKDHTNDRFIDVEDGRKAGEDKLEDFEGELELELIAPDGRTVKTNYESDDTEAVEAEVVEDEPVPVPNEEPADVIDEREDTPVEPTETAVSDVQNKDISEDPLNVMPGHFVDDIQGVPTINRKGYAVLAEHYGISVTAEPVTLPSETDFEYAEFRAIATTEDGTEYSGFGSAHVDRQDGDDPHLLAELAETRAMKRCVAWATGVGITAKSEMENSL